jgi:hypothetical protein
VAVRDDNRVDGGHSVALEVVQHGLAERLAHVHEDVVVVALGSQKENRDEEVTKY